jgi:hypothetical protein
MSNEISDALHDASETKRNATFPPFTTLETTLPEHRPGYL